MVYQFQLLPHANTHYQEALKQLGVNELSFILTSLGASTNITLKDIGGCTFLSFDAPVLTDKMLQILSSHSALLLMCEDHDGLLKPLPKPNTDYLPRDIAEVLKYKGKTSATFTHMMLNCARSVSDYALANEPLTVLDPMCGKGTTLFCALQKGMNAVGLDIDANDLDESDRYMKRYLQLHKIKHQRSEQSLTVKGRGITQVNYSLADTKDHYQQKDIRTLSLTYGDTAQAAAIMRKHRAHLLVTDLPYGIQHAPMGGRQPEPFLQTLRRALPAWRDALLPGGAVAISYNTLTLPRKQLMQLVEDAGFTPVQVAEDLSFVHFVEQAVTRDVLFATR